MDTILNKCYITKKNVFCINMVKNDDVSSGLVTLYVDLREKKQYLTVVYSAYKYNVWCFQC